MKGAFGKRDNTPRQGFYNLYDVFMTAHLMRKEMEGSPAPKRGLDSNPLEFFNSRRGRFERLYAAFLFVLVEAWESSKWKEARAFITAETGPELVARVEAAIEAAKKDGALEAMRGIRHYMFHRDQRHYFDDGLVGAVGFMHAHEALHDAFSAMFLAVKPLPGTPDPATT